MDNEQSAITNQAATSYFHKVSELLLGTQITDLQGTALTLDEGAGKAAEMILSAKSSSHKVILIGNGGSAAIASHMQNDLCKSVGVRAIVFNEPPLLTAISNDDGYENVFKRPVELWADNDDLLFAISSSGQSENILRASRALMTRDCRVITLSGFSADNPLRQIGHLNFYMPSQVYGYVEAAHSVLSHFLTDCSVAALVEKEKHVF